MGTIQSKLLAIALGSLVSVGVLGGCAEETGDEAETSTSNLSQANQQDLDAAKAKNERRMAALRADAARTHYRTKFGSEPYLKLHAAGETVKGTVVVFHGFSGMPVQQNPLVSYLFDQGYDVFNASVAGHYKVNVPGGPRSFLGSDQLKSGGLSPLDNQFIAWPYADDGHDPVAEYNAEVDATFEIMKTLRKPFFAAGLSAGATQAIGIAAKYPDTFKRVVAFAPLLDLEPKKKDQLGRAAGLIQLARATNGGQWDGWFAWDASNPFPQGCFWGLQKYGQSVVRTGSSFKARGQKLFLVTTDNEDAADSRQTKAFFDAAGGASAGNVFYNYRAEQRVPHPINGLDGRSQGMINFYYKTLFQETVRFFDKGVVKTERLGLQDLAQSDRGHALPGYTPGMDWETSTFGGPEKAFPIHLDLASVQ